MLVDKLAYELSLWNKGAKYIAGIDEVGRGPLAGPFVVCALVLDREKIVPLLDLMINDVQPIEKSFYSEINDSKLISDKKRRYLDEKIRNECISYSIIEISNVELDAIGVAQATQIAFYGSVSKLRVQPDHILTDLFAVKKIPSKNQTNIKGGDNKSLTVAAASIVAKVFRDDIMTNMHEIYPQYGFDQNKGYGTAKHLDALRQCGPCKIHRMSYEPLKSSYAS